MPELPEVQTIVSDLTKSILDYVIKDSIISEGYTALPTNETFTNAILEKRIRNIERIAKNILVHLEDGTIIHFHLAMTGQILLKDFYDYSPSGWLRVLIKIQNNQHTKYILFNDMRKFGKIAVINQQDRKKLIEKYGPEPIEKNLKLETFIKQIKSKKTNIKNALLDQKVISGLGNIYATDALFLAGIYPETSTQKLTNEQFEKLFNSSQQVLNEGIEHRGSTLDDKKYVDIFGNEGSHQNHFKIYSKQECPKCSTKVTVKKINGRSTYFCTNCQPASL